jgi:hypothetical protein
MSNRDGRRPEPRNKMRERLSRLYDELLVSFTLLASLPILILGKWSSSLDTWYTPQDESFSRTFDQAFTRDVAAWLASSDTHETALHVLVAHSCPCTQPTLKRLQSAMSSTQAVHQRVHYIDAEHATSDEPWQAVIRGFPSTPSALGIKNGRLVYAGPVLAGGLCTTSGSRIPALWALQEPGTNPFFNMVATGCFCRRAVSLDAGAATRRRASRS